MRWPRWLLRHRSSGDAKEARERAEDQLRTAQQQAGQVRREAAKPLSREEFVDRVSRAFRPGAL